MTLESRQKKVGEFFKGYRKRRGYDRKKLSRLTGLKLGRIADIENGRRSPIKMEEVIAYYTKAFLIPLTPFESLFPEDPYDYIMYEVRGKKRKKDKIKRKK